jgi:hypothetical protein
MTTPPINMSTPGTSPGTVRAGGSADEVLKRALDQVGAEGPNTINMSKNDLELIADAHSRTTRGMTI